MSGPGDDFDQQSIQIRIDEATTVSAYLARACSKPGREGHDRACFSPVNCGLAAEVDDLSAADLRQLAEFPDEYADRLEEED